MKEQTHEAMMILQEECSEVIQSVSKCFRFGIDGVYKDESNRDHLEQELGDVLAMIEILQSQGIVSREALESAKQRKFKKLTQWSTIVITGME